MYVIPDKSKFKSYIAKFTTYEQEGWGGIYHNAHIMKKFYVVEVLKV